jgi:hypothetical protein
MAQGVRGELAGDALLRLERATHNLIRDQGLAWVREHAEMLKRQSEFIASL